MLISRLSAAWMASFLIGVFSWSAADFARGQSRPVPAQPAGQVSTPGGGDVQFRVNRPVDRLEMTVNSSRILTMEQNIPKLLVNNPNVLQATPLSPNQIQVSAMQAGVTQLNLWDTAGKIYTVDVIVIRDAAELVELLKSEFPEATLHVRPMAKSVYIRGYVPRAEMVNDIMNMANDYFDNVINGITVGGVQQVALHVKVLEVSRSRLRALGLDWKAMGENFNFTQKVGGLASTGSSTIEFALFGNNASEFLGYLEALRQQDLAKLMAEPTLVTMSGRPASFTSGGSFPILVPSGLGTVGVEYHDFGTRVDFVPIVLGNGTIRLEVRPSVSERDDSRGITIDSQSTRGGSIGLTVPSLTTRSVDTAVELRCGQTLALAGLIQNRVEAQQRGIPYLGDLPWIGAAFSHVQERVNEVELLIIVTPEIVAPLDPHQVPQCGPGQLTTSPSDHDFFSYRYLEVPNACVSGPGPANCKTCPPGQPGMAPAMAPQQNSPAMAPPQQNSAMMPPTVQYPASASRQTNAPASTRAVAPPYTAPPAYRTGTAPPPRRSAVQPRAYDPVY